MRWRERTERDQSTHKCKSDTDGEASIHVDICYYMHASNVDMGSNRLRTDRCTHAHTHTHGH